mgnify:CR=1 FL=1
MTQRPTLIFDFDSTLVGFETLEALADVALDGAPDAVAVRSEIAALTDRAMAGEIPFGEALRPEFHLRADRFYNAPDTELDFTVQGGESATSQLLSANPKIDAICASKDLANRPSMSL